MRDITEYMTIIFDCDGVILNSNKIKTEAFYKAALPYGEDAARALVSHHVANGGISRYVKFQYLLDEIVPGYPGPNLDALLESYARIVRDGLMSCEIAEDLHELREATATARWMVASGGDQGELRRVFRERRIAHLFDGGIFGSPETKEEIIKRSVEKGIPMPGLMVGDSRYDFEVAQIAGIDFVFISGWSEMQEWADWTQTTNVPDRHQIGDLLPTIGLNAPK